MKLHDGYEVFGEIKKSISKLEDGYGRLYDGFQCDRENPEEVYKERAARRITSRLEEIQSILEWVEKPITTHGRLIRLGNGRYGVGEGKNEVELTSGHRLDYWDEELEEWKDSRIEHSEGDYYIVDIGRGNKIDDVLVRLKK